MTEPVLPPTFLFRFSVPCLQLPTQLPPRELELPEPYAIRGFGTLEDRREFAELRLGWGEDRLELSLRVRSKMRSQWCQATRLEDSDGLSVWIDTRDTQNIHRASRFCHRFIFLPRGGGPRLTDPIARLMPVSRARENPNFSDGSPIDIRTAQHVDGYALRAPHSGRHPDRLRPPGTRPPGIHLRGDRSRNGLAGVRRELRVPLRFRSRAVGNAGTGAGLTLSGES